ncbi:hypothetical protein [Flagellimonas pacifica]|uniref:Uncharacterized protein n=1 Tax=Flagellimonas pacifica TaxID=1247520 RepID=A0A285MCY2_9FLAO|nr:hypothetical protein [Allomuricauda parva]SNY95042.1 hypothetical protein SAMN06265377_0708 [Allomuricauda parva]
MKSILTNKALAAVAAFILTSVFVLWEHFNGGVITHHLLAREDLPGVSNLWGLLTIPLLSWLTVFLVQKRREKKIKSELDIGDFENKVLKHFLGALIFGLIASLQWELNFDSILQYYILLPILVAFYKPVHLPECLLGFVIGMLFTFGGILPIIVGVVLLIICFLVNKLVQTLKNLF